MKNMTNCPCGEPVKFKNVGLCGRCYVAWWKKSPRGKVSMALNRAEGAAEFNAARKAKRAAEPGVHAGKVKAYHRRLRSDLLTAYGNQCACCGETETAFLQLDHIRGGGVQHYRTSRSWQAVYREVRDMGYPKDLFRLLCCNCNFASGKLGFCPHEVARMVDAILVAV